MLMLTRFAVYGKDSQREFCYTAPEVIGMDLLLIGKFIAELRKEQELTQEQLGEKLGVTNKTVSRWETGAYLPPAEALLAMSDLFSVSINEILSGKRLSEEEYRAAAEENLEHAMQRRVPKMKRLLAGICIALALVLLVPIPLRLKDGGTVEYRAVLYSVKDVHRLALETENGYLEGTIIEILGLEVFNNVD
ncbi:MAG: helix-turn-helix transcriptional regulator [Ruminococcaceae bacterium]|nr:helix-turn-helix transcriptional regulator [Oscillospiraceae bacterium]